MALILKLALMGHWPGLGSRPLGAELGTKSQGCALRQPARRTIPNARLDTEFKVARLYITGRAKIETPQFPTR